MDRRSKRTTGILLWVALTCFAPVAAAQAVAEEGQGPNEDIIRKISERGLKSIDELSVGEIDAVREDLNRYFALVRCSSARRRESANYHRRLFNAVVPLCKGKGPVFILDLLGKPVNAGTISDAERPEWRLPDDQGGHYFYLEYRLTLGNLARLFFRQNKFEQMVDLNIYMPTYKSEDVVILPGFAGSANQGKVSKA